MSVLLKELERQIERRKVADHADRAIDLAHCIGQWFTLLLGQQASELSVTRLKGVGELNQKGSPLPQRCRCPSGESSLGGRDGLIELDMICPRRHRENLLGRRIDNL